MLTLFFLVFIFAACPAKENPEEKKLWPAQKALYDKGFQDAISGKTAAPDHQDSPYYADGYSAGEQSIAPKDELI